MTKRCLIVEDDPQIIDVIAETMSSIRHEFKWVTNQQEARTNLESEKFDYVLLDLEIPARPTSGTPMKEHGVRVLDEIQRIKGFRHLPVIIMSGYVAYALNRSVELRDKGTTQFIAKPFPEEGRTLGSVIEGVLEKHTVAAAPQKTSEPRKPVGEPVPFSGGELVIFRSHIEIHGVEVRVGRPTGRILRELNVVRSGGKFVAYSGDELATRVGCSRGQNGIAETIRAFRDRVSERLLEEANVLCGRQDIVVSGGPGYRFREWIVVRDAEAAGSPAVEVDEENGGDGEETATGRQEWILSALRGGRQLRASQIAAELRCSPRTARRELDVLRDAGKIEFVGPTRTGFYQLRA